MPRCNAADGGGVADESGDAFLSGNPAGYIADAIGRGQNATSALNDFRSDGGRFTTGDWYRLYGEVGAGLDNESIAADLDPYGMPGGGDYAEWAMGGGDRYATSINVYFRDRDTGTIGTKQYDYISDDPHTPAEAAAAAWDEYGDPENSNLYGQTLVGWSVKNVYQTVPWVGR